MGVYDLKDEDLKLITYVLLMHMIMVILMVGAVWLKLTWTTCIYNTLDAVCYIKSSFCRGAPKLQHFSF